MTDSAHPGTSGLLAWLRQREAEMITALREIVLRESPSHDKASCDELCAHLACEFERLGGNVTVHQQTSAGDHLQVDFAGRGERQPVLLLGHYDTVHAVGTLNAM